MVLSWPQKGIHTPTVTKIGTDSAYDIEFPVHPNGNNYIFSVSSTEFHDLVRDITSTKFRLYTRTANNTGPPLNGTGEFSVFVLA